MVCGWMTAETFWGDVQPIQDTAADVEDTAAAGVGLAGKTREAKQHLPKAKRLSKSVL